MRTPSSPPLVVSDVHVLDVVAGRSVESQDVHLREGRITEIVPAGARAIPAGAGHVGGRGGWLIPGLIDAHVHSLGVYAEAPGPLDLRWFGRQFRRNLEAFLRGGVTTVRDMGAPTRLALRYARASERLELPAPRMVVSGAMICAARGYPEFIKPLPWPLSSWLGQIRHDLRSPAQIEPLVASLARAGVGLIKTFWSSRRYDDAATRIPRLDPELLRGLAERARAHGLPLAVHSTWREDLDDLLALPFDSLEHLPLEAVIEEPQIERIVQRELPITTTLTTFGIVEHLDAIEALLRSPRAPFEPRPKALIVEALRKIREGREASTVFGRDVTHTGATHARISLGKLYAAGARIVLGTDAGGGITPCGQIAWEMEAMRGAGMSNADILRAATIEAARLLRRPELGRCEPGAAADLVLLEADPLEDVSAVRRIRHVIKQGKLYSPA
ncbi:MAG: amidohydrolase family protein [Myxococcales bacterium]|nr:amidohydrolase family protein [Myxococcales bacterium]